MNEELFRIRGHHLPLIHEFHLEQDSFLFYGLSPMSYGTELRGKFHYIAEQILLGRGSVKILKSHDDICDVCKEKKTYCRDDSDANIWADQKYLDRYGIRAEEILSSKELLSRLIQKDLDYYRNICPTIPNSKRRLENAM